MPQVVSARHAVNADEKRFVRMFLALGEKNQAEAYRRSFLVCENNQYFQRDSKGLRTGAPLPPRNVGKLASMLLKKDHIKAYIAELKTPASDAARDTLTDQVRFGDSQEALRAANRILDDEDKLGFRDACEKWAEIMCEVGAEVVVPIPGNVEADVHCPHCFETHHVSLPIEITTPMSGLFRDMGKTEPGPEETDGRRGKNKSKEYRDRVGRDARFEGRS
jgi:hypothetical protein